MPRNAPTKAAIIVNYEMIFGELDNPRLDFVKSYPKDLCIGEIASINAYLKRFTSEDIFNWGEINRQKEVVGHLLTDGVFRDFETALASSIAGSTIPDFIIIHRATCLFAIEEIVGQDENLFEDSNPDAADEFKEDLFKYLLCINSAVTKGPSISEHENSLFKAINTRILLFNQTNLVIDPFLTPSYSIDLVRFLTSHPRLSGVFQEFVMSAYGLEAEKLIKYTIKVCFENADNTELDSIIKYPLDDETRSFLKSLSGSVEVRDFRKLVSIKKFPIHEVKNDRFIILDRSQMLIKTYTQLLNDFWFDCVKKKGIMSIEEYGSVKGQWFEQLVVSKLKLLTAQIKHCLFLNSEKLTFKIGGEQYEFCDAYLRVGNHIFLFEVKSTLLNDDSKVGMSMEALYGENEEKFLDRIGVNQLVERVSRFKELHENFDPRLNSKKSIHIYPVLIFMDNLFSSLLFPHILSSEFNKKLENIEKDKKLNVLRLTTMSIEDLDRLRSRIKEKPKHLVDVIKQAARGKGFVDPFSNYVSKNFGDQPYPEDILDGIKQVLVSNESTTLKQ
ncbi:MAG: hypothetical protein HWD92_02260 [Flavobacteriia bacterium]|nr:hypothetical protein [Flavobacteriia bacterium]